MKFKAEMIAALEHALEHLKSDRAPDLMRYREDDGWESFDATHVEGIEEILVSDIEYALGYNGEWMEGVEDGEWGIYIPVRVTRMTGAEPCCGRCSDFSYRCNYGVVTLLDYEQVEIPDEQKTCEDCEEEEDE